MKSKQVGQETKGDLDSRQKRAPLGINRKSRAEKRLKNRVIPKYGELFAVP